MKIKLLILGILFAQALTAQEFAFRLIDKQINLIDSIEQEIIIDTVDVFATVINWNEKTVHQTFLKEVRKGHKESTIAPCPDRQKLGNSIYVTCNVLHTSEVTVWSERNYYFAMVLSGKWVKVPDSYNVINVIYKPENNDQ